MNKGRRGFVKNDQKVKQPKSRRAIFEEVMVSTSRITAIAAAITNVKKTPLDYSNVDICMFVNCIGMYVHHSMVICVEVKHLMAYRTT